MIPVLAMLAACPTTPPTPAPEPPAPIALAEPTTPPLPPPAPVDIAFDWFDGSACLMATRRTETLSTNLATVSNLNGVGSGVVSAFARDDGTWTIALEDRSGTARHTPSDADLLVALEELELGLQPTLVVAADGRSVVGVEGMAGIADANLEDLGELAAVYGSVGQQLWQAELARVLSEESLNAIWSRSWTEGWGFAYGRTWVADEPVEVAAANGQTMTLTYKDVVPCKFNEAAPLCVRIVIDLPGGLPSTPEARLRVALPPEADAAAEPVLQTTDRKGELVIEVATGFPWRWTLEETESHTFRHGQTDYPLVVRRKQDVSCDWRVAE